MAKKKSTKNRVDDVIKLRGCIEMALWGPEVGKGKRLAYMKQDMPIEFRKNDNTVVTSGRAWVLQKLFTSAGNDTTNFLNYIAIGTSTVAPTTANTLLGSENARIAFSSVDTTGLTGPTPFFVAQCTFNTTQGNAAALAEAGLFNVSTANTATMLSRVTYSTIAKTTSNTLAISYTISN